MPHYGFPTSETTKDIPKIRTRWLRPIYTLAGLVFLVAFLVGVGTLIYADGRAAVRDPILNLLLLPGAVSFAVFLSAAFLDWALFGWAINERFHRVAGKIFRREPYEVKNSPPAGAKPRFGVRLAANINEGREERPVEVVPALTMLWDTDHAREDFLDSRIDPDGTCELAIDPDFPNRAYLLPWTMSRGLWVLVAVPYVIVAALGVMVWQTNLKNARVKTRPRPIAEYSPSMRVENTGQYEVTTEGGEVVDMEVSVKSDTFSEVAKFTVTVPGVITIPDQPMPDGRGTVYFSAPGFARQHVTFEVRDGRRYGSNDNVKLYRKRYAVLHYAFNREEGRDLTARTVEVGRVVMTHWSKLPGVQTWQVWQASQAPWGKGRPFGDRLMLMVHNNRGGFVAAKKGETYERMTQAPESGYSQSPPTPLTAGQAFYIRDLSAYPARTNRYGKIFVEALTDTPPAGVRLIDASP